MMVISMLVASLEATWGSVIRKAERILPSSSGVSHLFFWASEPYLASTSMFPVSGAAQLVACDASVVSLNTHSRDRSACTHLASRPTLAQVLGHEPVLKVAEPRALLEVVLGQEHIPQAEGLGLLLQVLDDGGMRREALLGGVANLPDVHLIVGNAFFLDKLLNLGETLALGTSRGESRAMHQVERLGRALRDEGPGDVGDALAGAEVAVLRVYEELRHGGGFFFLLEQRSRRIYGEDGGSRGDFVWERG